MKGWISPGLHLAALLLAAVVAFIVFGSPEKETAKGETILTFEPSQLDRMLFGSDRKKVEVEARQGGGFTLTVTEDLRKPAPTGVEPKEPKKDRAEKGVGQTVDGGVPDGGVLEKKTAEQPAKTSLLTETKVASYRGNQEFEKTLTQLLPLWAERDLGQVEDKKLQEFGLQPAERRLTVEARGQKVAFDVGNQTYGGATTYLRKQPDGPVYLVSSALLRSLDVRAPRYLEQRLVGFTQKDVEKILVSSAAKKRELLQRERQQKGRWSASGKPDSQNEFFGNWVDKVFRLGAVEYVNQELSPPPQTVARLQFLEGDERLDEIELASQGEAETKRDYFGRSSFTRRWVKLRSSEAEAVIADLPSVLERD